MVPELKFGHRATTSLSTRIAAAEGNWGMASYALKIALYRYPSIIITFFLPKNMTLLTWLLRHYKPKTIAKEAPPNELLFLVLLYSYAVNDSYLTVYPLRLTSYVF